MKRRHDSASLEGVDLRLLWYAPDHRIRTEVASREALRVAEHIRGARRTESELSDQELFLALHTCAFRASGRARSRQLSTQEQLEWVERWRSIREYLVQRHLGLAYAMMARTGSGHVDQDDLESEAMLALCRAIDRFNPWRGFRFSTYACNAIARAVVRRGKQQSRYCRLFALQYDPNHEQPEDMPDDDELLAIERLQRVLKANLGALTRIEAEVLSHRFPAEHERTPTLWQIGHAVGLSKERVRQIQNIALSKLRGVLALDKVLQ